MSSKVFNWLLASVLIAGCASSGSSPSAPTAAGEAPAKPTKQAGTVVIKKSRSTLLRGFEEKALGNGLRILYVPDESLPYISFSLLVKTGAAADPEGQEGLSAFIAEMLDKGTSKRSAQQIARDLGVMGADFSATSSYDYSLVSASAISSQADTLLKNIIEIATEPSFSDAEIERVRKQMLASIQRRVDNPDLYADLAFSEYLFGAHPYGRPVTGSAKAVKSLSKRNLIRQYLRFYRPNNSVLAVVGKFTPEMKASIESGFGAWENREVTQQEMPKVTEPTSVQIRLLDKPDLVQAQIRFGHIGIARNSPDFLKLRLANTILGGAFASRLNDRLRKDLGLTYSIGSSFDARRDRGPFTVETFTKNASVGQAVAETLKVLEAFKTNGVTDQDVSRAKGYLKGIFPASIESADKLAFNLMVLRLYGIPDDYLSDYLDNVDDLSRSDVNDAIKKYITPEKMKILVYSNAKEVAPQLKTIAPAEGAVEVKKATEL
ncbi:MAG TPA: pitrilysin family protein [Bdellovibrionales bacterium]|nr:pitrilysin family protein [Bdellovibrionales bacterium]